MKTPGRGWWIDDDGFLREPSNVTAYDLDGIVPFLDGLTAENAMLREALVACCAAIAPIREGERNGAVFGNLSRADDQARAALAEKGGRE